MGDVKILLLKKYLISPIIIIIICMFPFCSYEEEEYDYYRGPRKKPVHERLTLPSRSPPRYQEQEVEYSSEEEKPKKAGKGRMKILKLPFKMNQMMMEPPVCLEWTTQLRLGVRHLYQVQED